MKLEVTVSEIADIFKEIQERPGKLFEMYNTPQKLDRAIRCM